jgi:hypothetical protein
MLHGSLEDSAGFDSPLQALGFDDRLAIPHPHADLCTPELAIVADRATGRMQRCR